MVETDQLGAELARIQKEIERPRKELSDKANTQKSRFMTTQWIVVIGGVVLILLGVLQTAQGSAKVVIAIAEAIISFVLAALVMLEKEFGLQAKWLKQRVAAEALKTEIFLYLGQVGRYSNNDDKDGTLAESVTSVYANLEGIDTTTLLRGLEDKEG